MTDFIEPDISKPKRKRSEPYLLHNVTILLLYFAAVIPHAVRYEILSNNHSIPYFLFWLLGRQSLLFVVLFAGFILFPTFLLCRKKSAAALFAVFVLSFIFYVGLLTVIQDQYFELYVVEETGYQQIHHAFNPLGLDAVREYFVFECNAARQFCHQIKRDILPPGFSIAQ